MAQPHDLSRIRARPGRKVAVPLRLERWSCSGFLASMRGIDREAASLRAGTWQTGLGSNLRASASGWLG
jgi:hypothetical protein